MNPAHQLDKEYFINLTQQLLDAIDAKDYATYSQLCSPNLSCVEPETNFNLVTGAVL
jgi:hypothetical protein